MLTIKLSGLYLTRHGRDVGIVRDRGEGQFWRWVTTLGYYVTENGSACRRGKSSLDLMAELPLRKEHMDGADSMWGSAL